MKGNRFLLILILVLATAAFWGGYQMVKRGTSSSLGSKTGTILDKFTNQGLENNNQESDKDARPVLLIDRSVVSITRSLARNTVNYFEKNTGKVFEFNIENDSEEIISSIIIPNFISAKWSPTKKDALLSINSPSGTKLGHINILTGEIESLSPNIYSAGFSPDGSLLAYYETGIGSDQASKIILSQSDGLYPKKLLNTRLDSLQIFWPIQDKIAIKTKTSELFFLSLDGKLTKLIEPKLALEVVWSNSGNKIIYSELSGTEVVELSLWIRDLSSNKDRQLPISIPASNCIWSIDDLNIFCIAPSSRSIDSIYKINILTGHATLVASPEMPVGEFILSPLEDYILFISAADNKLYSIKTGK